MFARWATIPAALGLAGAVGFVGVTGIAGVGQDGTKPVGSSAAAATDWAPGWGQPESGNGFGTGWGDLPGRGGADSGTRVYTRLRDECYGEDAYDIGRSP